MQKKIFFIILLLSSLFIFFGNTKVSAQETSEPIFFWGSGCPHCKTTINKMVEQGIANKLKLEYKEIYNNQDNVNLFKAKLTECNLSLETAGVPAVYIDGKCSMGEDEVLASINDYISKNNPTGEMTFSNNTPDVNSEAYNNGSLTVDSTGEKTSNPEIVSNKESGTISPIILAAVIFVPLVGIFIFIVSGSRNQ